MASKIEYQDLEVKGSVKANEFADGVLKNSGFEVVTTLPTTGLFEGREVMYQGKKYVYSSGWKEEITANTMYEANLLWGGRNISDGFSPIDGAMVSELSANIMAFPNPAGITVEYSRDGGVTWIDYGLSDADKINITTIPNKKFIYCGNSEADGLFANPDYRLRVIIDSIACGVYASVNKIIINAATNGGLSCKFKLSGVTRQQVIDGYTDDDYSLISEGGLNGWPGYNVINCPEFRLANIILKDFFQRIKIEFFYEGAYGNYVGLNIRYISFYGTERYALPSNLAKYNHLYSYDYQQNALFPAKVESKEVINFDVNNIEPKQTGNVTKTSTWLWQYLVQGVNWLKSKIANGTMSLNGTTVKLGDTTVLPWYVDYNDVNYPARLRDNWLQIYRNGVWGNLVYLSGQEAIQPTQVVQITSFDNLDWYNEQVSEYEVDNNTTQSILVGSTFPAAALMNCLAEQLTLNFYPISGKKYGKGSLDSLIGDLQGKGFTVFVENDLDAILSSGSDYLVRIKICKVPTAKAIIECYVSR